MNRNVESHFAQLPHAEIERSVLDMSHGVKTSFNAGRLIPFDWIEVLPGDTWKITSSKVIRAQTMLTPIYDNLYLDTYWFFVPSRLVWDHFEEFMGANKTSAWIPSVEYQIPTIVPPENGFSLNTIADYMGYPVFIEWNANDPLAPSVLPIRCYAKVCQDWFLAETVSDPLNLPTGDTNQTGSNGDSYINDVANGGMPFKVARYHDYFSSCLPSPLRANENVGFDFVPTVNINTDPFPVGVTKYSHSGYITAPEEGKYIGMAINGFHDYDPRKFQINSSPVYAPTGTVLANDTTTHEITGFSSDDRRPINLWTNLPDDAISLSGSGSFTINELRLAFQLQKFYEKAARAGSGRYIEIIAAHFNVTSPDARLQRSEYLGGNRIPISIHEVTNTAQGEADFLGDLGAKVASSDVHQDVEWSSTEHGYIIGVMAVRYDNTYPQGMKKALMRRKFSDFYWPVFANIGEQPVYDAEIYADADTIHNASVFGYQEAYADYRFSVSTCTSEMRPGVPNTLASWHLADYYTEKPTLSDDWMRVSESNVDRTLAVTSEVANQFFADIWLEKIATRPMPVYSVPGLIDHH